MKVALTLGVLVTLTSLAQAQERPVPDINKSPWSGTTGERSDGLSGTSTTTIKREIGDGLSVGGQMKTPYQDPALAAAVPPSDLCWRRSSRNAVAGINPATMLHRSYAASARGSRAGHLVLHFLQSRPHRDVVCPLLRGRISVRSRMKSSS